VCVCVCKRPYSENRSLFALHAVGLLHDWASPLHHWEALQRNDNDVGYGDQAMVNEITGFLECDVVRSGRHVVTVQKNLLPLSSGYI